MSRAAVHARRADEGDESVSWIGTKILADIFTDEVSPARPRYSGDMEAFLVRLWDSSQDIYRILKDSSDLEEARDRLYTFLDQAERRVFDIENPLHILEKATVRECVRVFRSIIGPVNEMRCACSALNLLRELARDGETLRKKAVSIGFLMEFIHLFRGVQGKSNIYHEDGQLTREIPEFLKLKGRRAAEKRMEILDETGDSIARHCRKYPSGLDEDIISRRHYNRERILKKYRASAGQWDDYKWHLRHVFKDGKDLFELIDMNDTERQAVEKAVEEKIPFGITPYYLHLMDRDPDRGFDHAVRAQVLPPADYVAVLGEHRRDRSTAFDFMGEHDTSPVDTVTRRYPGIAILKPFNTCAQICVYCQRNWEIDRVLDPHALVSKAIVQKALDWFDEHPSIGDVLITGGDPMIMKDEQLEWILAELADKPQVYRIRIGTRTPVVLPMRFTEAFMAMITKYHDPPKREIAFVTHFEHSYEVTPEAMEAVQKLRKSGISVYNQEVFTIENSRRFESVKLRRDLKSIGVDPYYTFNMKGKSETASYMVPIARLLQERKEEARLLPGLDRTDEPVFNVPRLGKNHLRAGQDRRLVMIMPDGSRVYEFHPWEKNISAVPPYNYVDVPIYNYLEELAARGEDIRDYRTIWYYY